MSQIFKLQLATTTLTSDANQIGVSTEQLQLIQVTVHITLIKPLQLKLTYQIYLPERKLAKQFDWPQWQPEQVTFTDYLWERTCLECFISDANLVGELKPTTNYIEINASPNGRYALYQFESYRQPDHLPPMPLCQADNNEPAYINWIDDNSKIDVIKTEVSPLSKPLKITTNVIPELIFIPCYSYERGFTIALNQLLFDWGANNDSQAFENNIALIHPCVILRFGEINLYFAPKHSCPPDFHQQSYWTTFNL